MLSLFATNRWFRRGASVHRWTCSRSIMNFFSPYIRSTITSSRVNTARKKTNMLHAFSLALLNKLWRILVVRTKKGTFCLDSYSCILLARSILLERGCLLFLSICICNSSTITIVAKTKHDRRSTVKSDNERSQSLDFTTGRQSAIADNLRARTILEIDYLDLV